MTSKELAGHFMFYEAQKKPKDRQSVQSAEIMIDAFIFDESIRFAEWINKNQWQPAFEQEDGWEKADTIEKNGKIIYKHSTTQELYLSF